MPERISNFDEAVKKRVKAEQDKSLVNKAAKWGKRSNLITIPIGLGIAVTTGILLPLVADVASGVALSEVQNRNNKRIENQERGRIGLMSRKSRLALVSEVRSIAGKKNTVSLKKAA